MGSFERKLKRAQQRATFNRFTEEWAHAKRTGQKVNGKPLGKKPPFSVFKKRLDQLEAAAAEAAKKAAAEKLEAEKKLDLEWKEP